MLPRLETIEVQDGLQVFHTTDGIIGCALHVTPCDLETENAESFAERLSFFLRTLNPRVRARVWMSVQRSSSPPSELPRAKAYQTIGFRKYEHTIVLEFDPKTIVSGLLFPKFKPRLQDGLEVLKASYRSLIELGFQITPFSEEESKELFVKDVSTWVQDIGSVETGDRSYGVVRLLKPASQALGLNALSEISRSLPEPFQIIVSLQRMSPQRAEIYLQRRLRQSFGSRLEDVKHNALEETLEGSSLHGISLIQYEFLVVVERSTKALLRRALSEAGAQLKPLGDIQIETIGCGPSFVASHAGSSQHVPILEGDKTLPVFIPLFRQGEVEEFSGTAKRALTVSRVDNSIAHIDLLDPRHQNANAVVVGSSGKGKSVFLGTLTHSLLNDESVRMIKVDVGGSHSRECAMLGGQEFKLSIDQPSGLNPFALLRDDDQGSEFVRSVLGQFLECLIKEDGEVRLSKSLRSQVDECLREYLIAYDGERSLDSFYEFALSFPRRELLSRWCDTGIYANAFRSTTAKTVDPSLLNHSRVRRTKSTPPCLLNRASAEPSHPSSQGIGTRLAGSEDSDASSCGSGASSDPAFIRKRVMSQRLTYFNFSEVFQAADPEFAQAAMAAVLAIFNLEMKSNPNQRLALVCDETPFFIERSFEFFKFSAANVRKFGASLILVVQLSKHLIVGDDRGVIENCHHRFLFSSDGERDEFTSRLNLSDDQYDRIQNLRPTTKYSEFLYQKGFEAKTLRLELTREEYWRLTSTQSDRLKLDQLMRAIPNLKVEEAIRCLSVS